MRLPSALAHPLLRVDRGRRRRIMRAVRAGRPVDDPRDAPLAVETAQFMQRTAERARSPRLLLVDVVLFGGLALFVLAGGGARLPSLLPLTVVVVAAVVLRVVARFAVGAAARRAAEAEEANRHLAAGVHGGRTEARS